MSKKKVSPNQILPKPLALRPWDIDLDLKWECWQCQATAPRKVMNVEPGMSRLPEGWAWDDTPGEFKPLCTRCNEAKFNAWLNKGGRHE